MENKNNYDIAIVGAGMVGAALACKLIQDQPALRIALIEANVFKPTYNDHLFDARVVALTASSQKFLNQLNVWKTIKQKRVCHYKKMEVWDGSGTGEIQFDCKEVNEPALGAIVENSIVVEALLEKLRETTVEFLCPEKVSAINLPSAQEPALIVLESGKSISASLLIATDGANSKLRELANLETRQWSYGHTAIVCTVQTEQSHQHVARQCFTEYGPLAFLPLQTKEGDTHFCSIVWSVQTNDVDKLLERGDVEFAKILAEAFEKKLGDIISITKRISFPLSQRHCKDYFKPGFVVAGDAAHTIHPLAGQGVNLGFHDIEVLTDEISRAVQRNIALTDVSILQRYQRRRKGANLAMMAVMEGFKRLFSQQSLPVHWLRNEGMKKLDLFSPLKKKIIKQAMGL